MIYLSFRLKLLPALPPQKRYILHTSLGHLNKAAISEVSMEKLSDMTAEDLSFSFPTHSSSLT